MFTIIYTSGTTGVPKGVVLTHENLVAGVSQRDPRDADRDDDVQYLFLPLAHVLGRELEWCAIQIGCETAFSRGTAQIKEDLVAIRPTFMAGVPRIFEKFYAGVKTALGQGSGLKRKIAAWALRVGAANSAAVRAGQPRRAAFRTGWPTSWCSRSCARSWAWIARASWCRAARRWRPRSPSSSTAPAS